MLDTRASMASKVSELRVFALEVLDNLLTNEIKPVVLPILDDLSVSERLAQLDELISCFVKLRDDLGMRSLSMGEVADQGLAVRYGRETI